MCQITVDRWVDQGGKMHTPILDIARELGVHECREGGLLVSLDEDLAEVEIATRRRYSCEISN